MQQPEHSPQIRRKSRKRPKGEQPSSKAADDRKRLPLTLQITGAIAAGLMLVMIFGSIGAFVAGGGALSYLAIGVVIIAGLGFLAALVMFGLAGYELVTSRCPECGKFGAYGPTGKSEFVGGVAGLYQQYLCSSCGYDDWVLDHSYEDGSSARG